VDSHIILILTDAQHVGANRGQKQWYATAQENITIFTSSITSFQRHILSHLIDSSTCALFSCFGRGLLLAI